LGLEQPLGNVGIVGIDGIDRLELDQRRHPVARVRCRDAAAIQLPQHSMGCGRRRERGRLGRVQQRSGLGESSSLRAGILLSEDGGSAAGSKRDSRGIGRDEPLLTLAVE
jgi:hypothetical protein